MAFSLTDETPGATPIAAMTKDSLAVWLDQARERERNWVTSTDFSADPGKHALVPGETGKLGRAARRARDRHLSAIRGPWSAGFWRDNA